MGRFPTIPSRRRGMSLVEILVTMFVLVVGLLAVIRVLVPGLQAIPRSDAIGKATQLGSRIARAAEAEAGSRPDAILRGIRLQGAVPAYAGWRVYHDVGMEDVDQISLERSVGAPAQLRPFYPNLVCGELFDVPAPFQRYFVESGPYVTDSLRAYLPDPWEQVAPGAEDDGDPDHNARTFSVTGTTLTLDQSPDIARIPCFIANYTVTAGVGQYIDIVGEVALPQAGSAAVALAAPGAIVPYSVTLYEGIMPTPSVPAATAAAAGAVELAPGALAPGTRLACMYEMVSHVRDGFDNVSVTRRPKEQELPNNAVPDILSYDTYVPLDTVQLPDVTLAAGEHIVKLPVDAVDTSTGLDSPAGEPVRVVARFNDGSIPLVTPVQAARIRGAYVVIPAALPAKVPIRVYYRAPGNWSVERHVAAANYSLMNPATGQFIPLATDGLKQCWFAVSTVAGNRTLLTYHASPTGTALDFWAAASPVLVFPEADGHRVSVDYRYNAGGGLERRVTGETHLVDFSTHAFALDMPNVTQIDSVRGASYKTRVCFDGADRKRVRVDVDTIVMR
jgi:hypothetical protein